jgi:hypothetical protein
MLRWCLQMRGDADRGGDALTFRNPAVSLSSSIWGIFSQAIAMLSSPNQVGAAQREGGAPSYRYGAMVKGKVLKNVP